MSRKLITCLPRLGFPHFPRLCSHSRREAAPPLPGKVHQDCYELVFISSGLQYRAANGTNYPLSGGQALLIQPGHRHSTGIMPQGVGQLYWIHIKKTRQPLLGMSQAESQTVFQHFQQRSNPVLYLGNSCRQAFESLLRCSRQHADAGDRLLIRQSLLKIILLIMHAPSQHQQHHALPDIFQDPTLLDQPALLARQAGISLSRLRARCKDETGISLGDYLLHLRIDESMKRIAQQAHLSITDIALDLGFSSSQYFATVFKRYTALTPSQFRKELNSPEGKRRLEKLGIA